MSEIHTSHNIPELTVSEISDSLKRTVEEAYPYVRVRGEISGFKRAASGHLYLSLKDDSAVLSTVCWKGVASRLPCELEDGLEVVCTGRITTFGGQSKYQLVAEFIEPAGVGALMALLEKRKAQLAKEGLFDVARKRPLPFLPDVIGVITSPTGAVIRDILHRLEERFPRHVLLWPVLVQGDKAAEQIAAAIEGFNALKPGGSVPRPDVLIVARGGGSLEDLWPFNEEIVVRAAANSKIPLISAIGHETDTTLIDYASDLRAPTPTAAAEKAVPIRSELLLMIDDLDRRALMAMRRMIEEKLDRVRGLARGLPRPHTILEDKMQRLDSVYMRLSSAFPTMLQLKARRLQATAAALTHPRQIMQLCQQRLSSGADRLQRATAKHIGNCEQSLKLSGKLLESYHYKRVLERGFALVKNKKTLITSASGVLHGAVLTLEFHDGETQVLAPGAKGKKGQGKKSQGQGDLF